MNELRGLLNEVESVGSRLSGRASIRFLIDLLSVAERTAAKLKHAVGVDALAAHQALPFRWTKLRLATLLLPPREREVLCMLHHGLSEKQIAGRIGISAHTVHVYVKRIHRHFGVECRGELLSLWIAGVADEPLSPPAAPPAIVIAQESDEVAHE